MQPPIDIVNLFPGLNKQLISFLSELPATGWQKQTVARQWVVKDVAAHLLDVSLRKISSRRDDWRLPPDESINSNEALVQYLNRLNADWVKAAKRLSPQLLVELLSFAVPRVHELIAAMDPFAPSLYPVSWAGESMSYNWFDNAREYTEHWLHQQQIRDALGNTALLAKEFYYPLLHIFLQAWPYTAFAYSAPDNTVLKTVITGEGGGEWFLQRSAGTWRLATVAADPVAAETIIDGSAAWKLFSKSLRKEDIPDKFEIKGERRLGEIVLNIISVMA